MARNRVDRFPDSKTARVISAFMSAYRRWNWGGTPPKADYHMNDKGAYGVPSTILSVYFADDGGGTGELRLRENRVVEVSYNPESKAGRILEGLLKDMKPCRKCGK